MERHIKSLNLRIFALLSLLLPLVFVTPTSAPASPISGLPEGFIVLDVATGLDLPVEMEIMPDGGILVAEKGIGAGPEGTANVRIIRDGALLEQPVITISTNVRGDSGLQGLVLDPDFAENGYFYLWHATGINSTGWGGQSKFRLTRYTFDPATETAVPASELILVDKIPWGEFHNGGGMSFANDGTLLLATGDIFIRNRAQNLTLLNGKLLRIRPTETGYTIPADNPFIGNPDVADEIYGYGLRSPFSMTRRESDGKIFIGDVGEYTWEEMSEAINGANYGWPQREGPCPNGEVFPCDPSAPQVTDPVFYYQHPPLPAGSSITAIGFYEGERFPDEYHGMFFFADLNQQYIATAKPGQADFEITMFLEDAGFIVDAYYYEDELYFIDIAGGKIFKVLYVGPENEIPIAKATADPLLGPSPLEVAFSSAGSAGVAPLSYEWDFGDGGQMTTGTVNVNHTYQADGNYVARLEVVDALGRRSNPVTLEITAYSGEMPTIELNNLTEPGRTNFHAGDIIEYSAVRSTMEDLDPFSPYTWRIDLNHNQHVHPLIVGHVAVSDTLEIASDDHGGDWNIWYTFHLIMRTDDGIEVKVSKEIFPALVELTFETRPETQEFVNLYVDEISRAFPFNMISIVGVEHTIEAPEIFLYDFGIYEFYTWTWDFIFTGPNPLTFLTPVADTTYTAAYDYIGPTFNQWMPYIGTNPEEPPYVPSVP